MLNYTLLSVTFAEFADHKNLHPLDPSEIGNAQQLCLRRRIRINLCTTSTFSIRARAVSSPLSKAHVQKGKEDCCRNKCIHHNYPHLHNHGCSAIISSTRRRHLKCRIQMLHNQRTQSIVPLSTRRRSDDQIHVSLSRGEQLHSHFGEERNPIHGHRRECT